MVGDNHTWLANRSAQCGKKGRVGAASKPGLLQLWAPHCPKWRELEKEAVLGQLHSLAAGACVTRGVGACMRNVQRHSNVRVCVCLCACSVTTQMLYPLGSGAWQIYRAVLQRLALHFQTSNFFLSNVILIKTSSPEITPRISNQIQPLSVSLHHAWLNKSHKLDSVNDNNIWRLCVGNRLDKENFSLPLKKLYWALSWNKFATLHLKGNSSLLQHAAYLHCSGYFSYE